MEESRALSIEIFFHSQVVKSWAFDIGMNEDASCVLQILGGKIGIGWTLPSKFLECHQTYSAAKFKQVDVG